MTKFEAVKINEQYYLVLNNQGNVELHKKSTGIMGTMNYYYTRNDLPLFICNHYPSASLRKIHEVMIKLDRQLEEMVGCGCLQVGGQNVAINIVEKE